MQQIEEFIQQSGMDIFLQSVFSPVHLKNSLEPNTLLLIQCCINNCRYPSILMHNEEMQCFLLLSIQKRLQSLSHVVIKKIHDQLTEFKSFFLNTSIVSLLIQDCEYALSDQNIQIDYNSSYTTVDWNCQQPCQLFYTAMDNQSQQNSLLSNLDNTQSVESHSENYPPSPQFSSFVSYDYILMV